MDAKQYFRLGAQLIGLYYLVWALPIFVGILPWFIDGVKSSDRFGLEFIRVLLAPIILFSVGFYLLRGGSFVQRLASEMIDGNSNERMAEFFTLGVKLFGIHLVLGNIPVVLSVLSNFLFAVSTRSGVAVAEGLGMKTNFFPYLVLIMFGILLLVRGELLTRWAFPTDSEAEAADC